MLADYRLACYPVPIGSATCYSVGNTFSTSDLRLRRLGGRIRWPKLLEDNEFYEHLNVQKDLLNESMQFDFDRAEAQEAEEEYTYEEVEKATKVEAAKKMYDRGDSQREIADVLDVGKSTISDWKFTYGW